MYNCNDQSRFQGFQPVQGDWQEQEQVCCSYLGEQEPPLRQYNNLSIDSKLSFLEKKQIKFTFTFVYADKIKPKHFILICRDVMSE